MADAARFQRIAPGAGWVEPSELPKGPNGRALCRRCSTEVPKGRKTFCSSACVDEWKIRTQPAFAKLKVFERDNGICIECAADTLKPETRDKMAANQYVSLAARLGRWEMDHVVPVVEGGGACGLDNLRTLCKPCHRKATAALAKRRAEQRRANVNSPGGGASRSPRIVGRKLDRVT